MSDLRAALTAIEQKTGGLTPEGVVEAAKPKDHPLHDRFEWDNRVAGHRYRLVQADHLIRSVKVRREAGGKPVLIRQYEAVRRDGTYQSIDSIAEDALTRELLVRQAEREWRSLYERWKHLEEFLQVVLRDAA